MVQFFHGKLDLDLLICTQTISITTNLINTQPPPETNPSLTKEASKGVVQVFGEGSHF